MCKLFYPDEYYISAYAIPYEELYEKGFRGIIYDIDNTLVPHGAPADERSIALFERLKIIGYDCVLLSNNKQPRVDMFNKDVNVHTISKAGKPKKTGYLKACEMMGTTTDTTLFIGDQIFTDVLGARRTGIHSIMVKYMDPKEELQIVLKRKLEKLILFSYLRHNKMLGE